MSSEDKMITGYEIRTVTKVSGKSFEVTVDSADTKDGIKDRMIHWAARNNAYSNLSEDGLYFYYQDGRGDYCDYKVVPVIS
jgi:hypothetical protein